MPEISCQTENQILGPRQQKNYFDCGVTHKKVFQDKINRLINESDFKLFCNKIGLRIDEIRFTPNDFVERNISAKLTFVPFYLSKEMKVYKWMSLKDLINISCSKYEILKKFLKKNYLAAPPCLEIVRKQQLNLDNSFTLYQNDFGFFLCPKQKIQYACEKFLERNEEFVKSGIKRIKIRFCSDGVRLSKKHLTCLNFVFTTLNDEKNCMSVFHTYILG